MLSHLSSWSPSSLPHPHAVLITIMNTHLSQIFNTVDVVMRRWRDETDTRDGVTSVSYLLGDFVAWELSTFAWFCSLSHFDLQLICVGQVRARHAKPSRCNLPQKHKI